MLNGQDYLMFPIGPGDDEESRGRRDTGRVYNSIALVMHWDCASKEIHAAR